MSTPHDNTVSGAEGLARPSGQALVSDQAPAGLAPSGFDPSRACGDGDGLRRRDALTRMVELDEELETAHPGWMTGAVNGWIPIKDAPDQAEVLVCREGLLGWWAVAIRCGLGEWWTADGSARRRLKYSPTHFQHLPLPPKGVRIALHGAVQ